MLSTETTVSVQVLAGHHAFVQVEKRRAHIQRTAEHHHQTWKSLHLKVLTLKFDSNRVTI